MSAPAPGRRLGLGAALAMATAIALAACASAPAPGARDGSAADAGRGAPAGATVDGATRCAAFAASPVGDAGLPASLKLVARFEAAGPQPAGNQWRPPGLPQGPVLPAHCVLGGAMDQRTGVDGKPYETRFELRLPDVWSGRLLYQGGGGNDGIVNPATGRNAGSLGDYGSALSRGFAAVTTDAGHQGPGPEFGVDPQARVDKAHAAHDRVARTAKALIAAYYGRPAGRSYFLGCSGGGRQGMMFAQRHPDYFDGVVSVAPAMGVAGRATPAAAWDTQLFLAIAPKDAQGRPILSQAFSPAALGIVARGILAACDAQDGLADGMVSHPQACRFDPASVQCGAPGAAGAASGGQCLQPAQVQALARAFRGPVDAAGRAVYVGQPWDPGIAAPGWRAWKLGTAPDGNANANNIRLMGGALGLVFATPPDPQLNTTNFDVDRDLAKLDAFSRIYDTYRDDRMDAYFRRGGRFMIVHGMADGIFSASESIDYVERLGRNHGGLDALARQARLFLVPGMNHCAGGPATDEIDALGAMVDWVEQGRAPARITARARADHPQFPGRSRPLCPYPSYARYAGAGDPEAEQSFACAMP